jgi:hypothetical protein
MGTWQQAELIIEMDILKGVYIMLSSQNYRVIDNALSVLDNILIKGEILKEEHSLQYNYCFTKLEETGVLKQLENLQNIQDEGLYTKVSQLIDKYLPYE